MVSSQGWGLTAPIWLEFRSLLRLLKPKMTSEMQEGPTGCNLSFSRVNSLDVQIVYRTGRKCRDLNDAEGFLLPAMRDVGSRIALLP